MSDAAVMRPALVPRYASPPKRFRSYARASTPSEERTMKRALPAAVRDKLIRLGAASLFARAIRRVHRGESLVELLTQ